MGKLSTHVLDTTQGRPASGVRVDLYSIENDQRTLIKTTHTNSDGRCDEPLLQGEAMHTGVFELVFHAGAYFAASGVAVPEPRFVDQVGIRFGIADANANYHVPLVVTPWSWSTYRGS
ncbi:hydroxyisourate hydrolase [Alcaligenes faecalis]|uniref:hydroxyisourate hydrolase n=1 Tax=Alcaligenes faecalis TaxID=511 RepID=UPI001292F0E6|nr:hydroxyisourate hydrolase [Alcaligenes faecalis]MBX6963541.1 hydroxyisourate hydrolase [Providencia rettgeri]MBX7030191.1 hydroxyisourate hydrolase [Alcaligenes faecalis]QFY78347.1 hydroxyisourate hydrolase [Alcaligenes faecalis]